MIAGKAVAFGEALQPSFSAYIEQVLANTHALGCGMASTGLRLVTGGTDNHLLLVDLTLAGDVTARMLRRPSIPWASRSTRTPFPARSARRS